MQIMLRTAVEAGFHKQYKLCYIRKEDLLRKKTSTLHWL